MISSQIGLKRAFQKVTFRRAEMVVLALLASSALLIGQSERGAITGEVHDSSGAVVPGARVVITNSATGVASDVITTTKANTPYQACNPTCTMCGPRRKVSVLPKNGA